MRYLVVLAACGLLCGCYAAEDLRDQTSDLFRTNAEIRARNEAADKAACQRLGAMPGTDIYVQCMIGRAQVRATNNAAASARANSGNLLNSNTPRTESGLGRNGMACLGQTVQTPYGPQFNCY